TPDIGLMFVTVQLNGTDVFGNSVSLTTTTDGLGQYAFQGLAHGTYVLTEIQPAGYLQGTNTIGDGGGTISGDSMTLTLDCGQTARGYNLGEILPTPVPPPPPLVVPPPPQTPPAPPPETPPPPPPAVEPPPVLGKFSFIRRSWLDL